MIKKSVISVIFLLIIFNVFSQSQLDLNLLVAADKNLNDSVVSLLKLGANPNAVTYDGVTPLMYASENGNLEICKMLIDNGADVNIQPKWGSNALIAATQYNHPEIVEFLILSKAKFNLKDDLGYNALSYAVAYGFYKVADILLYYGASHILKCNNVDPMMIAAFYADTLMIELLLDYGADINSADDEGITPLMIAVQNDSIYAVKFLIKKGAEVNKKNLQNQTALNFAVINKNSEIAEILINSGAETDYKDKNNITPYSVAIFKNDTKTKNILKNSNPQLKSGLIVNKVTFSFLNSFNSADYMIGMDFGLHEAISNVYIYSGILTRPFYKNVIFQESENLYYQLKEKRTNIFLGIEKHFNFYDISDKTSFGALVGFRGIYSYGEYKAVYRLIEDKILYCPYAGIFLKGHWTGIKLNYDFLKMAGLKTSPHRFTISWSVYFNTKNLDYPRKELFWF